MKHLSAEATKMKLLIRGIASCCCMMAEIFLPENNLHQR
jgi:hypothetical protein